MRDMFAKAKITRKERNLMEWVSVPERPKPQEKLQPPPLTGTETQKHTVKHTKRNKKEKKKFAMAKKIDAST